MLSNTPGRKLDKYVPDYVIFDLETTGTSCQSDAVIEISAVKVINGIVADEFSTLVDPGCSIPYAASMINGIYDEMVQQSPCFEEALLEFLDFAGDLVLVGHNIHTFDMKFINRDAMKYWDMSVGNDYIDTWPLSKLYLPQLEHHRLVDLADYYGISTCGAHRALNDCRMNQQVFEKLALIMQDPTAYGLKVCPKCGSVMKQRKSKYGDFLGCSAYPACKYILK